MSAVQIGNVVPKDVLAAEECFYSTTDPVFGQFGTHIANFREVANSW